MTIFILQESGLHKRDDVWLSRQVGRLYRSQ